MNAKRIGVYLAMIAGVTAAAVAPTVVVPSPAHAGAATPVDVSVRAGALKLRPAAGGGYIGTMTARVRYTGPDGAYLQLDVAAPEGLYFFAPRGSGLVLCTFNGRYSLNCLVDGPAFAGGETRDLRLEFTALAKPTRRTRASLVGSLTASALGVGPDAEATPHDNTSRFRGLLAGTGHGFDGRPYRPATRYDLSATGTDARFVPDPDGAGYVGTTTVTMRTGTDAYHQALELAMITGLPGLESVGVVPPEPCFPLPVGWTCWAGNRLPEGARRTLTVQIHTRELPPAGAPIQLRADTNIGGAFADDARPADNTVTVRVV